MLIVSAHLTENVIYINIAAHHASSVRAQEILSELHIQTLIFKKTLLPINSCGPP